MPCEEAFYMIQRYYDGELATEEQQIMKRHLLACPECQREFDEYGALFHDIDRLRVDVEHRDILSQTLERLEEASQKRKMEMWWRGVAVAASVAIIAGTSFLYMTDTGNTVRYRMAQLIPSQQTNVATPVASTAESTHAPELKSAPDVFAENDSDLAAAAILKIREQAAFPLLELQDDSLKLVSTSMFSPEYSRHLAYQMVELDYVVQGKGEKGDVIHFLATPDNSQRVHSKYNLGVYTFNGEVEAGPFRWARVGEHALTAELNGVFYQLFSPFLTTDELAGHAAKIKRVQQEN